MFLVQEMMSSLLQLESEEGTCNTSNHILLCLMDATSSTAHMAQLSRQVGEPKRNRAG
jgi:hypothetical protein